VRVDSWELSVVAPCLDEEANVPLLVERLRAAAAEAEIRMEIVLVDDGSTDGTWEVIERLGREHPDITGVRHSRNLGIAAAWRSGVEAAQGEYVGFIDADLQNPPAEMVTLYRRLLESPHDIAQGTRSSIGRVKDSRLAFSRVLNTTLNTMFGMRARDNKSGFVVGPRTVMRDVVEHRGDYRHFQTFIAVSAVSKGYSILEIETLFESRNAGTSFLQTRAMQVSGEVLTDLPRAFVEFRLRAPRRRRAAIGPQRSPRAAARHPYRGWRRLWFEAYFATMPAHKWLIRRRARDLYLELQGTQWWSRDQIAELQLAKLQRLVQHAYVHVPYYREAMNRAGVRPQDVVTLDDLARIPLLGKDDVRRNLHFNLFADTHRKRDMHRISTSGSTGEPFTTYADRHQLEMRFATTLRALEWTGWRFGDRQARLWHQTLGMSRTQVLRERIDAFFMRRLFIPAFEISPETLEEYVGRIRRHRPVLVDGYAESLNFLATYIRQGGTAGFSPAAVMSSAQALPDNIRAVIESGFSTTVFDKYGSREFSGIAYECREGHDHHVMDESYIVELLVDGRPAQPGEIGEIVITDLNNFSVPLIRYRIGDLATAVDQSAPCPCGRGLSRVGTIHGRTQAIVHCADGTWLPGTFFAHFFKEYEHLIRHFQVHQEVKGAFTLRVVKNAQFTKAAFAEMLSALRGYTGTDTHIEVDYVTEIPLVRTGKRSPVVSTVREDFQTVSARPAPQSYAPTA
jgi:phenylacetate-CoA ligase